MNRLGCLNRGRALAASVSAAVLCAAHPALAQTDGDAGLAVLGGALGAYSGAGLGLIGGLVPCDRSVAPRCARVATAVAAAGGMVAGSFVGYRDEDELERRLVSSGYGAVAGAAAGLILREAVRQYSWSDVLAAAAVGGAVGASAVGAGVGLAVGASSGFLLWKALGVIDASDAVALGLGGVALGGLIGWAVAADSPDTGPGPTLTIPVSIAF